jgi:hypothetical protein
VAGIPFCVEVRCGRSSDASEEAGRRQHPPDPQLPLTPRPSPNILPGALLLFSR